MFAPMPIGLALLAVGLLYFRWVGRRWLGSRDDPTVTPARTESYFARTYGIAGEMMELTVTSESPLVGMSVGEAEAQKNAPLYLAIKTGNEARLAPPADRSEEHTSELQSLMRISYAVFCLTKQNTEEKTATTNTQIERQI